ncbi:unnamed protein product [Clonostachys chloroleuca]|uniref:Jacalin-type lectin domain-containing protein n=1 Tax=Clonostachys chloroleuca TaxID=1926264 RepID=A0AA35Q0V7_9HYPO|nr:unnamed protein product [Clonostachys chloroleuca]
MTLSLGNPPTGGTTTAEDNSFTIRNELNAVQTITVWIADGSGNFSNRKLVKAIKVKYSDGTERAHGNQTGTSHSFKFDSGEKVKSMSIWTGLRVDRIKWVTHNNRTFDHGGKDYTDGKGGTEYPQDVGNGILLGFEGTRDANELVSLGSSFKEASD